MTKRIVHHKKGRKTVKISNNILVLGVIILLVIAAAYYLIPKQKVAAVVNNENIYEKKVESLYNSLPPTSKLTKSQILERLIDTKLLVQYINTNGYGLTDDDFNKELDFRLKQNNLTLAELNKQLSLSGSTLDDVRDTFVIESFVQKLVLPNIHVTASDIAKYRSNTNTMMTDQEITKFLFTQQQTQVIYQVIQNQRKTADIKVISKY